MSIQERPIVSFGSVKGLVRGQQQQRSEDGPEEKVWERVLDCLSLGLCHLFK